MSILWKRHKTWSRRHRLECRPLYPRYWDLPLSKLHKRIQTWKPPRMWQHNMDAFQPTRLRLEKSDMFGQRWSVRWIGLCKLNRRNVNFEVAPMEDAVEPWHRDRSFSMSCLVSNTCWTGLAWRKLRMPKGWNSNPKIGESWIFL